MATIKSYTDLQQSMKLAEILPIESADMYYPNRIDVKYQGALPIEFKHGNPLLSQEIAAWSLAALLDVFEDKGFFYKLYFDGVSNVLKVINIDNPNIHEMNYNDYAIDVCYEMIIKLHEYKIL